MQYLVRLYVIFQLVFVSASATFPGRKPLTSLNSPFHALELLDPRKQVDKQEPVCCLVPLPPVPDVKDAEEEVMLLSFEEWKQKMFTVHEKVKAEKAEQHNEFLERTSQSPNHPEENEDPTIHEEHTASTETVTDISPHFRVPTTDRFNYAATDCSARVHGSHKSAKSPSSILYSKKDRYMLSPCSSKTNEMQHVVVELCDDIRIDTVQLANFEFFSGVFKDFEVSVAKTFTTDPSGWTSAGIYRAKNVRSVQSFHPPSTMRDFYRYIRIDFLSHYGSEYYCPVSLLRVYGLTHLELWKWEKWEEEFLEKRAQAAVEDAKIEQQQAVVAENAATDTIDDDQVILETLQPSSSLSEKLPYPSSASSPVSGQATPENATVHTVDPGMQHATGTPSSSSSELPSTPSVSDTLPPTSSPSCGSSASTSSTSSTEHSTSSTPSTKDNTTTPSSNTVNTTSSSSAPQSHPTTTTTTTIITSPTLTTSLSTTGGESIYKLIMTKLAMLENNQSREREVGEEYRRYFEDQLGGVRSVLKRLSEESGRIESLTKSQAALLSRSTVDWDRQRGKMEAEYGELVKKIEWLSDEITLEKRLGIAQICLLIAVLVFLGLTRGEVHQPIPNIRRRHTSSREWIDGFRKSWRWRTWGMPSKIAGEIEEDIGSEEEEGGRNSSPIAFRKGNDIAFPSATPGSTLAHQHTKTSRKRDNDLAFPSTAPSFLHTPRFSLPTPTPSSSRLQRTTPFSASRTPHHHHLGTPLHLVRRARSRTPSLRGRKGIRSKTPVTPRTIPLPSSSSSMITAAHTAPLADPSSKLNQRVLSSSPLSSADDRLISSKPRRRPNLVRSASSTSHLVTRDGSGGGGVQQGDKKGRTAHLHAVTTSPTFRQQQHPFSDGEGMFEIDGVEASPLAMRRRQRSGKRGDGAMNLMSELFDRADGVFDSRGRRKKWANGFGGGGGEDADVEGEEDEDVWVTDSVGGDELSDY